MAINNEYRIYCMLQHNDDVCDVIFVKDGNTIARRSYIGCNDDYINDAMDNWISGILKVEHFTMEERLRA